MQRSWTGEQAQRQAIAAAARVSAPEPVIVTVRRVHHITPEPVIVHKKVYRTVRGEAAGTSTRRGPAPAKTATRKSGSSKPTRTVVAPAPAPARAKAPAPPATTSKTS